MKLSRVSISEHSNGYGLPSSELSRLGDIVILAGKNGSGKSRVLRAVQRIATDAGTLATYNQEKRNAASYEATAEQHAVRIQTLESQPQTDLVREQLAELRAQLTTRIQKLGNSRAVVSRYEAASTDPVEHSGVLCVEFLPKRTSLSDERDMTYKVRDERAERLAAFGVDNLSEGALPLIRQVQTAYREARDPITQIDENDRKAARENYDRLDKLVQTFIGVPLGRNLKGEPTLFDRHPADAKLSDGQVILLQLCVQLYAQGAILKNVVLFLDEPENHLHPAACIDMIESIRRAAPSCQIWIATHSLSVISYFTDATLLFVESGKVRFAGSVPQEVFGTLLGNDDRVGKLQDFLSLPAVYAMNRYGAECLLPPTVAAATDGDAQTAQIRLHIDERRSAAPARKLRVLDYGAGKGRLLENLAADWPEAIATLDYVAFDEFPTQEAACRKVLKDVIGDDANRYFSTFSEITAARGIGKFDVLVMCNVLHEIPPAEWTRLFGRSGQLVQLLAEGGVFLLVEDQEIPTGELAHSNGFIVLDTAELSSLFAVRSDEVIPFSDYRSDGRLKAHVITRDQAERVTTDTTRSALLERVKRSKAEIQAIRSVGKTDYSAGRRHAFWLSQFANASLALE